MTRYKELPLRLKQPSTMFGVKHTLILYTVILLLLVTAPYAYRYHLASVGLYVLLLGVYIYKLSIYLHECVHGTLFHSKRANAAFGWITGAMLGTHFKTFADRHWQHHRTAGRRSDPQGRDYLNVRGQNPAQVLWHLFRPLLGYNLFKVGEFQAAGQPTRKISASSRRLHLALTAFVQLIIGALTTGFGDELWLALLYPVSAVTVGLFLSQIRGFCEHLAPVSAESDVYFRTHKPRWFDKLCFYDMNFNFHVEHHRYPQIPACHLATVHSLIRGEYVDHEGESPSILSTLKMGIWQSDVNKNG